MMKSPENVEVSATQKFQTKMATKFSPAPSAGLRKPSHHELSNLFDGRINVWQLIIEVHVNSIKASQKAAVTPSQDH